MKKLLLALSALIVVFAGEAQNDKEIIIKRKDRRKDVLMQTTMGDITIRLSDSTPLHRDNFIKLVKQHYYDSVIFHRVIKGFMVQAGDPNSKRATAADRLGNGGPSYTVPAEIKPSLFHKKGVIAAARTGDDVNPLRASSGSQFYLVQGRTFTDSGLDSLETMRLKRKISDEQREVYKRVGGTPFLDQQYTVFGEVVKGVDVIDKIAAVETNREMGDRPVTDVRIINVKLVKRKKKP